MEAPRPRPTHQGVATTAHRWPHMGTCRFPDNSIPGAPTGLDATSSVGQVALVWNANAESDIAGYNVYRSTASPVTKGTPLNGSTPVASPAYSDVSGSPGTLYHYAVAAVDTSGNVSSLSSEDTGTPAEGAYGLQLGTSSYVTFGDPTKLDLAAFTVETWFNRTGDGTSNTTGGSGIPLLVPLVTHGAPRPRTPTLTPTGSLGSARAASERRTCSRPTSRRAPEVPRQG